MIYRKKQRFKNNAAFCLFSPNFGPFYTSPNSTSLQKLTPLRAGVIKADKVDGFIRFLGGEFRYLVLFNCGLFDKIYNKIKYLISEKTGITDSINHNLKK